MEDKPEGESEQADRQEDAPDGPNTPFPIKKWMLTVSRTHAANVKKPIQSRHQAQKGGGNVWLDFSRVLNG